MAPTGWLIDTSALVRLTDSLDRDAWRNRLDRGLIRIAALTRLEVGFSARSGDDLRAAGERSPMALMPVEYLTP